MSYKLLIWTDQGNSFRFLGIQQVHVLLFNFKAHGRKADIKAIKNQGSMGSRWNGSIQI